MPVRITRVYTRTGDDGTTGLGDFSRTAKTDSRLVAYADTSARSGYEAMKQLLDRERDFTALFAGNDTVAFGAMKALKEAGLRIPQDVAVAGALAQARASELSKKR